jgi:hypothetical protein
MAIFWDVAPCSLVDNDQHFKVIIALMKKTTSFSETMVNIDQTTWYKIPEASHLYTQCCENLNSHLSTVTSPEYSYSLQKH